ncbi:TadE family type IV pilus minor pilin [Microbacterium sp. ARD32]|uniref:TadE family type IV pilus minor pilin n=1 Tax=Microbacterium sp. ARD32 TaxID=2962577 RepID=UPI002881837A|nr:TadE family type IV pilus minor pilin [Microbacterium sp. ARD32]MDT0158475.1 TadE family type IV pilus minor pilin [Microbacterium sp. ARD32]
MTPRRRRRVVRCAGAPRSAPRGDRGSIAAELAIALPAVLLALLLGVGALHAAATQVMLQDAAADAARLLGRGESVARARAAVGVVDGAAFASRPQGDLVCVTASLDVHVGRLISIPLRAASCALDGGL